VTYNIINKRNYFGQGVEKSEASEGVEGKEGVMEIHK
jgi:hypothetical protein